ncbi:Rha family transcriptional regulator [Sutterella wadsworthensis]|uniref:Rha family transcriptional regulator n=1 Tax=Sutterella wadsworthensis TaxID=40545 RepID=UPI003967A798
MLETQNLPVVSIVNGQPTTLSTDISNFFEKPHNDVLKAIRAILSKLPEDRLGNFSQTVVTRTNPSGGAPIQSRAYRLTRDGFTFLAMGFTGEKAQVFKWAYIDAFNRMEEALRNPPKPEYITVEHRWAIQKAVGRKARGQSVNYQTVYRALKDHFKVEKYTHILEADFDAAIAFIEPLPPMQLPPPNAPTTQRAPAEPPRKAVQVNEIFMDRLLTFVYCWRYLFRDELETYLRFLRMVDSPRAPHLWEAIHDLSLSTIEVELAKYGYDVKELDCYKSWASHQPKRLTA